MYLAYCFIASFGIPFRIWLSWGGVLFFIMVSGVFFGDGALNLKKNVLKKLNSIQNLGYSDKKKMLLSLPISLSTPLYCKFCNPVQLKELFIDWDDIASNPGRAAEIDKNIEYVQGLHIKKIKALVLALRKIKSLRLVPGFIVGKY